MEKVRYSECVCVCPSLSPYLCLAVWLLARNASQLASVNIASRLPAQTINTTHSHTSRHRREERERERANVCYVSFSFVVIFRMIKWKMNIVRLSIVRDLLLVSAFCAPGFAKQILCIYWLAASTSFILSWIPKRTSKYEREISDSNNIVHRHTSAHKHTSKFRRAKL